MVNSDLVVDLSPYIAAQYVRGKAFRDEQLVLIEWSARQDQVELSKGLARMILKIQADGVEPDEAMVEKAAAEMRARTPISADPKAQVIQLMVQQWLKLIPIFVGWRWAIYRAESPLLTSDEPVVLIGAPGTDRGEKPGFHPLCSNRFPPEP
ncbi:hypothetical protein IFM12275_01740 [Nocardia sputorum]|uniref:DUF4238 domain-containing protein n=1 Tax=Nocardia sputorum TaxID=2984338 RepID=UPI0024905BFE|nr:DUF4238 domain-containing protein [Nocardia sputorum]BDT90198.1 hypothetical protein IFM12275_01740 [Nocardia sputorum]